MMNDKMTGMRIVPYTRYEKRIRNGVEYEEAVDNLTIEEIRHMSCLPRKIWVDGESQYVAELPLMYRGTGLKGYLCYVFDDLTEEEQEKYFDRSIIIMTTVPGVVQIYGETKAKTKVKGKN